MASQAERDAEVLKDTFNNLTESIRKSAKESGKLKQTFLELSSTANASGQAWTVVSRLTSGTGFWKIQNRIRAFSNFFQFQERRLNEQVERETKQIQLIKDQIIERERLAKAQMTLNKIQKGSASSAERQAFFMSDQFRYLEGIFGRAKAIETMTTKIETAQGNLLRNAGIRREIRGEAMSREFEGELSASEKFFNPKGGVIRTVTEALGGKIGFNPRGLFTGGGSRAIVNFFNKGGGFEKGMNKVIDKLNNALFINPVGPYQAGRDRVDPMDPNNRTSMFRKLTREQEGIFAQMYDSHSDFRQLSEDLKVSRKEEKDLRDKELELRVQYNSTTNELDKSILKSKIQDVVQRREEGKLRTEDLELDKEKSRQDRETARAQLKSGGVKTTSKGDEVEITEVNKATLSLTEQFKKTKFFQKWEERYKTLKGINFKGIFSSLMTFLRAAIIYGGLIIGLLMLLKTLGVIDLLVEFFRQIVSFAIGIYEALVEAFAKFIVFGAALFNFFNVLFTGNRRDSFKALGVLLFTFTDFLLSGIGGILTALIGGIFKFVLSSIVVGAAAMIGRDFRDAVQEGLSKLIKSILDFPLLGSFLSSGGAKVGATIGFAVGGPVGAIIGAVAGYGLGAGVDAIAGAKAMGGPINKSGTYLVGERGPELVSLAAGQYVTPNHQLGGTVNIHINGRIGASETELRDIGNRLGDIINNRGNRVGNTRMFR